MLASKAKSLVWFASRPKLWPQAFQIVKYRLFPNPKENTATEATEWCRNNSVNTEKALNLLGITYGASINEIENTTFKWAEDEVKKVPYEMGGPGELDLLYYTAFQNHVKKIVETGVSYGWSSLALLLAIKNKEGHLISTDMPYLQMDNEDFVGCTVPQNLRNKWKIIRLADRQGLPMAIDELESLDMCHYDSDKTYEGRMWAYPLLWKHLNSGGYFISDDINDNIAFKDFAESLNIAPIIVKSSNEGQDKYVGLLVKP